VTAAVLTGPAAEAARPVGATCAHCGLPAPSGQRFCCPGCGVAFDLIQGLGLGRYYRERLLDPALRPPRPELAPRQDLARHVSPAGDGLWELTLAVDGLQCGACVWLIESVLAREPALTQGRVNMTSRRLRLVWRGEAADAPHFVGRVEALGYRLVPFEQAALAASRDEAGRALLRALAVAGFAAGNVMLIALGTWFGSDGSMGPATRELLQLLSALIAVPAIAYAGRPFFASALAALRHGRTNMDVPVSIGVVLVTGLSLWQALAGGAHTYFESAVMLLFFLLLGRLLDHRARGRARAAVEELLTLRGADVAVLREDGSTVRKAQHELAPGALILTGMGERIGADGVVAGGASLLDTSLVTGESLPVPAQPGTAVFAGTLNLGAPLTVRVTACGGGTMLAECVRLIEAAEARRGRYVVLADRVARAYAPVVHLCALATFLGWMLVGGAPVADALLAASAVLIITCPCALALAVPAVQVIATGRLFAGGILLKSPTALERVADADLVCFDKTGTLTEPELRLSGMPDEGALREAAAIAASSRHPLARALCAASGPVAAAADVQEHPGEGLSCPGEGGTVRLGSARFCGIAPRADDGAELWLARPGQPPVRFGFAEHVRGDAAATIARLRRMGLGIRLLSGDRASSVARIAAELGIADWQSGLTPAGKVAAVAAWQRDGARVLMVGDGLNDGPALSAASVSASPSTAADLSQTVADLVFQGRKLAPVAGTIAVGRRARRVMRQNLALALFYNAVMIPVAMAGLVTPWLAAAAMSLSSLLVMANSARVRGGGG
jgi:P-type Cu2+ transporter